MMVYVCVCVLLWYSTFCPTFFFFLFFFVVCVCDAGVTFVCACVLISCFFVHFFFVGGQLNSSNKKRATARVTTAVEKRVISKRLRNGA